jgi:Protein of unknown function (DUF3553)
VGKTGSGDRDRYHVTRARSGERLPDGNGEKRAHGAKRIAQSGRDWAEERSPVAGPSGLRVIYRGKPEWGLGHVLADNGGAKVTIFFLGGGRRIVDTTVAEPDLVTGKVAMNAILDVAARANWQHAHHNLYAVELKPEVCSRDAFVDRALDIAGLPILRVPAQRGYAPGELRGLIEAKLTGQPTRDVVDEVYL